MIEIDKLCYNSKLRYVNAGEKFAFAMMTLFICVMSRSNTVAVVVLGVMGTITVWKGGIPLSHYLHFVTVPFTFLLLGTLAVILHIRRVPMELFAIPVGNWYLTTNDHSLLYGLQLILTALGGVSCLCFLALTTPIPDLLEILRMLRCPKLLSELMLLIYRFIFILLEAASAITISQKCRLGNKNYKTALKSFGMLGSAMMIRAMIRSGKLFDSMEARCYDGTVHVLSRTQPPKIRHVVWIIAFDGMLLLFAICRRLAI